MRVARAVLACLLASACQPHREREPLAFRERPGTRPFTETIPGSRVTFTMRPFEGGWIAETETTWDAYDVFYLRLDESAGGADIANAGREGPDAITRPTPPYSPPDFGWGHSGYPAIGISFHAAQKYCEWLTQKTGRRYRLPSVGEFREALGQPFGPSLPPTLETAWLADNAGETTHPVRAKRLSPRGLYDVCGNVAEWCVGSDGKPVVCGGSFRDSLAELGERLNASPAAAEEPSVAWQASDPSFPRSKWWLRDAPFVGFRVVCEEGPE